MSLGALEAKWGAVASAHMEGNTVVIDAWRHPTLPRPTAQEVAQAVAEFEARASVRQDIDTIKDKGKDMALVLVEFIEWALANTTMRATDFSPEVRTAFQDIKAIADRLRA